ncbi:MAG: NAD(P)/FAD-dependent oxidoreductase [Nitrososphaerota archaeon]|jgi:geranylgeranyl reductase family protein|nr:NAD(P)/FAD-dependent oxidoreductase [Nitrososphaerota archaeon]MDG6927597.1 NAD(P)/FAD-dependent oxidoreductase [Nitrososphaerota archaeon]MDG6929920.1 NAD(P)/FAD-dependent oxidoreductase [Nitrososphaerota archaeon]MDG6931630.1 NAD(P)/FAD-dependent oxidoreductase [Nitrososphaerota archaeon]MDG6935953.1 NAD(P)/FAD-dependent oxidoreductase [Nitrososphaerota archaeon]
MVKKYNLAIKGAGPAGLLAAREAARRGESVVIFEEDREIGVPEKCGGLISLNGLIEMKVSPIGKLVNEQVKSGQVVFAEGKRFEFDLSESNLIVLDREEFDKQLAVEAVKAGSEIKIGTRIEAYNESNDGVSLKTTRDEYRSDLLIDAGGVAGYANKEGLLPATQFVYAVKDGFYDGIMVFIDKNLLPDFFGWYIPLGDGLAKVGSAGDPNFALKFMEKNLQAVNISGYPVKTISSSLVVGGISKKANRRTLKVGDAGGQTKPTTGGGIVSGGLGGMLAGAESVKGTFADYNKSYDGLFGSELKRQLTLANVYKKMPNDEILKIISEIHEISNKLSGKEFDFHSHLVRRLALNPTTLKIMVEYIPDLLRELV